MLELLVAQPMLLLFLVLAVGYAARRVRVGGVQLGPAAVLFAGLAAGTLDSRVQLPEFVRSFGLVIFVYSIGISSGPGFIASLRRRGLRNTAWTVSLLLIAAGIAALPERVLGLPSGMMAGLFCGALSRPNAAPSPNDMASISPSAATATASTSIGQQSTSASCHEDS